MDVVESAFQMKFLKFFGSNEQWISDEFKDTNL